MAEQDRLNPSPGNQRRVLQPAGWPRPKGYANGISARGRLVSVAGTIGWNAQEQFEALDLPARCARRWPTSSPCWPRMRPGPNTSCA